MKHPQRIIGAAVVVAWCFDFLFWEKSPGVSFAIFIAITVGTGMVLAWREKILPDRQSLWLLIPVLVFACGTFIRREPLTTFANMLFVFGAMGIFAQTYVGGRWLRYSWSDYVAAFFSLLISVFVKPFSALTKASSQTAGESQSESVSQSRWKRSLPYLRGLLIAAPILVVFASLFAAADPIFADYLEDFTEVFKLEKLPEYIFRGFYILILGYALAGIYLHAFTTTKDKPLIGEEKPWLPTFLGFTESAIVLGSMDVLFSMFVGIQFRYFFGGQSNIKLDGFTYAEYARRGFGELVVVSFFSLLLFLGLSAISRRENKAQRRTFSAFGVGLVLLVIVILVSAFQRLLLYERAYGFTRLRTYSHLFMIWLGVLVAAVLILELFRKQRAFALAGFFTAMSFVFSLNLVNVDGLIVNQNVNQAVLERSSGDKEQDPDRILDAAYLFSLSSDATPALIHAWQSQQLSQVERDEVAAVLACQLVEISERRQGQPWQSFHVADERAWNLLREHRDELGAGNVYKENGSWWILVNHERRPCNPGTFGFD